MDKFQHQPACLTPGGGTNDDDCICSRAHIYKEHLRLGLTPPEPYWRTVTKIPYSIDPAYSIEVMDDVELGLPALKAMFPNAQADAENIVLFSTSGTHGSYLTIEEIAILQTHGDRIALTFLIIQPRLVKMRYGQAYLETEDDFAFVRTLRSSASAIMSRIGY